MRISRQLPVALGVLLAGACASKPPTQQLAQSEAAVRTASNASEFTPEAARHLQMAEDRMQQAKALKAKGEYTSAAALLDEARLDAALSSSLTREQEAAQRATQARQAVDSIE